MLMSTPPNESGMNVAFAKELTPVITANSEAEAGPIDYVPPSTKLK